MTDRRCARLFLAVVLPAAAAGCATSPYATTPPADVAAQVLAAIPSGAPYRTTIAVCYNGWSDTPAEVMEKARETCPNNGEIERVAEDFYWNPCSLSHPTRAVFACTPGPEPPSKFK